MTENREKAIKRTKNLAYWFMGEMLKEEERGEKEKEAFEKAKEAGELVVMISTAENNARVMKSCIQARVAQWIAQQPPKLPGAGSSPAPCITGKQL